MRCIYQHKILHSTVAYMLWLTINTPALPQYYLNQSTAAYTSPLTCAADTTQTRHKVTQHHPTMAKDHPSSTTGPLSLNMSFKSRHLHCCHVGKVTPATRAALVKDAMKVLHHNNSDKINNKGVDVIRLLSTLPGRWGIMLPYKGGWTSGRRIYNCQEWETHSSSNPIREDKDVKQREGREFKGSKVNYWIVKILFCSGSTRIYGLHNYKRKSRSCKEKQPFKK